MNIISISDDTFVNLLMFTFVNASQTFTMIAYSLFKETSLSGRYISMDLLNASCFSTLNAPIVQIGKSVDGEILKAFSIGRGTTKVLMWSQMHGNESTTTKAVWDMVNFLGTQDELALAILEQCTLMIVPMLNPDGAKVYTRVNSNQIDLNRDAKERSQPESQALRQLFQNFKPDFCFNLHDQRTLFSAGNVAKPATVSFLSPASNKERDLTPNREVAMQVIVAMNNKLQELIPGQVGRYDDGFNDNCVGDAFQMAGVPTILFEAGHYPKDYQREKTREYIFYALVEALNTIAKNTFPNFSTSDYFKIPENEKLFFDILMDNANSVNPNIEIGHRIGIRYKEVLENGVILFKPEIVEIGLLTEYFGHETWDCSDSVENLPAEIMDLVLTVS